MKVFSLINEKYKYNNSEILVSYDCVMVYVAFLLFCR